MTEAEESGYEKPGIACSVRIDPDLLPESIREIKDLIGLAPALRLVETYGGTKRHIPTAVTPKHRLAVLLGYREAQLLAAHLGGTDPYIPLLSEIYKTHRNREIIRKYDSGVTAEKLARQYKLSVRQVWYILKQPLFTDIPTSR